MSHANFKDSNLQHKPSKTNRPPINMNHNEPLTYESSNNSSTNVFMLRDHTLIYFSCLQLNLLSGTLLHHIFIPALTQSSQQDHTTKVHSSLLSHSGSFPHHLHNIGTTSFLTRLRSLAKLYTVQQ